MRSGAAGRRGCAVVAAGGEEGSRPGSSRAGTAAAGREAPGTVPARDAEERVPRLRRGERSIDKTARTNEAIRVREVRLINADGAQVGVVTTEIALRRGGYREETLTLQRDTEHAFVRLRREAATPKARPPAAPPPAAPKTTTAPPPAPKKKPSIGLDD